MGKTTLVPGALISLLLSYCNSPVCLLQYRWCNVYQWYVLGCFELLRWIAKLMQTGCMFTLCCATVTATSYKWIEVWVINRNRFDLETWDKICIPIQIVWIHITPCLRISPQHARFVFTLNTEGSLTWKDQRCGLLCMPGCFFCLCGCEWNKMLMLQARRRFSIRMLLCFYKGPACKFHLPLTVLL